MKLIIDIDTEDYETIKKMYNSGIVDSSGYACMTDAYKAISNGEKLEQEQTNSILEQIKAEIEKNIEESEDDMFNVGMEYTLEIIDKYISGKRG